jgi:hypothetical protein
VRIFATSVQEVAQGFLHPGYLSAYPHSHTESMPQGEPALQLDLTRAFELTEPGEASLATGAVAVTDGLVGLLAGPVGWGLLGLSGVSVVLALVWVWYRKAHGSPYRSPPVGVLAALLPLGLWMVLLASPDRGGAVVTLPGESDGGREYADPRAATLGLMYGPVGDALANDGRRDYALANAHREVVLPVEDLTQGQRYALDHFTRDGWGRRFDLSYEPVRYTLTSAGEDGDLGTGDDLSRAVFPVHSLPSLASRETYYVRRVDEKLEVLFHRPRDGDFLFLGYMRAAKITGNTFFDHVHARDHARQALDRLEQQWESIEAAAVGEALVLLYFGDAPR